MGRLTCSICKKKKPLIGVRKWYRCSRHGVICSSCAVTSWVSSDKCPKCGKELKVITNDF